MIKSQIEAEMPLILAKTRSDLALPDNFQYTCLTYIEKQGIFTDPELNLDSIFAAGTKEGPVILFGRKQDQITKLSLLCGHTYPVTDVSMTLSSHLFVSVSYNSVLCGWSTEDGHSVFRLSFDLRHGQHRLAISPNEPQKIWIWTVGFTATQVNLSTGQVLKTLPLIGITSFAFLSKTSSLLAQNHYIIAICRNNVYMYTPDGTHIENHMIPYPHQGKIIASTHGIVSLHKKTWSVLRTDCLSEAISDVIESIPDTDSLCDVSWSDPNTLCLATFDCRFFIIKLHKEDNHTLSASIIAEFSHPDGVLLSKFSFSPQSDILFIPTKKKIVCVGISGFMATHISSNSSVFYQVDNADEHKIMQASSDGRVSMTDKTLDIPSIHDVNLSISSLFQRKKFTLFGCQSGKVFILRSNSVEFCVALSSKIVGFALLPFHVNNQQSIIVISEDGSCCLIVDETPTLFFASGGFSVISIHSIEQSDLILIGRSDGSYMLFNTEMTFPIAMFTELPLRSYEIWAKSSSLRRFALTTNTTLRLGESSVFLTAYDITMIADVLNLNPAPYTNLRKDLNLLVQLLLQEENGYSLVYIGSNIIPTFFYQRIKSLKQSSFISLISQVSMRILQQIKVLNIDLTDNLAPLSYQTLPVLSQLLSAENYRIQLICYSLFVNIVETLSLQDAQELYTILDDSDTLLRVYLSSQYTINPNFNFLSFYKDYTIDHSIASLIYFRILTKFYKKWGHIDAATQLILRSIVTHANELIALDLFEDFCQKETNAVLKGISIMIKHFLNAKALDDIDLMLDILKKVVLKYPNMWGTNLALLVVSFMPKYPVVIPIIEKYIPFLALSSEAVLIIDNLIAIGDEDGCLHVYRGGKLILEENMFKNKISMVLPDLKYEYLLVVSYSEGIGKVVSISNTSRSQGILIRSRVLKTYNMPEQGTDFTVEWGGPNICQISVKH